MPNAFIIGLAALAMSAQTPDAVSFSRCRTASQFVGECNWRRGNFIVVNGAHSSRVGFNHGKPSSVAVHQVGEDGPDEWAPKGVGAILSGSPTSRTVEGDYLVCPLKQPLTDWYPPGQRPTIACIAGARRLIGRKRLGG